MDRHRSGRIDSHQAVTIVELMVARSGRHAPCPPEVPVITTLRALPALL